MRTWREVRNFANQKFRLTSAKHHHFIAGGGRGTYLLSWFRLNCGLSLASRKIN